MIMSACWVFTVFCFLSKFSLIISDRDLKEAQPSQATTLDIYELYHLLDKVKVKSIISRNLFTTFNLWNMVS